MKTRASLWLILALAATPSPAADVTVLKTPDDGIQPQAVADGSGVVHLVYFKGSSATGDLYYVHTLGDGKTFSKPFRVNSVPGSAVAIGTIRGGQIAVGKGGRVHVAWNGSNNATPANPNGGSPMLYSRLNDAKAAFEPQRNLMRRTTFLDGGGTVAADGEGRVYVAWHAHRPGAPEGEKGRAFFVARSDDDGATFTPERNVLDRPTGACGCCGSKAFADRRGNVYALYRAATDSIDRDIVLLTSADHGDHFAGRTLAPWRINICPMSSLAFAEGPAGVLAAWENDGRVAFARIDPKAGTPGAPIQPSGETKGRKHPTLAVNDRGATLLAWTEGTGWQRGGALAWQVFDADGKPTTDVNRLPGGIPVWSLPTAVTLPDGRFLLIH
ncbi:MAG TPA: hypothetical protein VG406_00305 [Isosphaeraceae bacterium]|jgi:hypothetical protein|nr:hypothetical protein [Isosphaeraceae bacterium]